MNDNPLIAQQVNSRLSNLNELVKDTKILYEQQIAYGTRRAYKSGWNLFVEWCIKNNFIAQQATPSIVAIFLTYQFKEKNHHSSTINRRLAAIKFWFKSQNLKSPTEDDLVHSVLKGIRRDKNVKHSSPKKATLKELIMQMVDLCPSDNIRGIRDRAILLLGFSGAYRRSELVSINIEDITFQDGKGMDIFHRYSKTDQEGKGEIKAITQAKKLFQYCPIGAVKKWIDVSNITSGALFRGITKGGMIKSSRISVDVIYNLIKDCTIQLGYEYEDYSPHSLRSGFITEAVRQKARFDKIRQVSKHKSLKSMEIYFKDEDRYEDHPGENIF
jgi:site-specific recombinase XerD